MKRIHLTQQGSGSMSNRGTQDNLPQRKRTVPSEFLSELQSAASMIMSREECEALARELEMLRRPRAVAA